MKKMKTQKILALLVAMIMAATVFMVHPITINADSADFDTSLREGVAAIFIYLETDDGSGYAFKSGFEDYMSLGTGFFVGEDGKDVEHILTNYHVVEDYYNWGSGQNFGVTVNGQRYNCKAKIRVYFDSIKTNDYVEAYPVEVDSKYDVALLRLEKPTGKRRALPIEVPDDGLTGSTIYALGFPGLNDSSAFGSTTTLGLSDVTVTKGAISRFYTEAGTGLKAIIIDCDIKHGNSGGPLISKDGKVIGINTFGVSSYQGETSNGAVNIYHAKSLLDRNSIKYTTSSEPVVDVTPQEPTDTEPKVTTPVVEPDEKATGSSNLALYIIIAIVALIVIGAVVLVIVLTTRKKGDAAPAVAPAPAPAPVMPPVQQAPAFAPTPQPQAQIPVNAAAPNPYAPADSAETSVLSADGGETTVLSADGGETTVLSANGGTIIRVSNNENIPITYSGFTIGKKRKEVDYCIGDNTNISRNHAKFIVRDGETYITDNKSTNGTFVNNTTVRPGDEVLLKDGDTIMLADEKFIFKK